MSDQPSFFLDFLEQEIEKSKAVFIRRNLTPHLERPFTRSTKAQAKEVRRKMALILKEDPYITHSKLAKLLNISKGSCGRWSSEWRKEHGIHRPNLAELWGVPEVTKQKRRKLVSRNPIQ
jgi:hypothetical protein